MSKANAGRGKRRTGRPAWSQRSPASERRAVAAASALAAVHLNDFPLDCEVDQPPQVEVDERGYHWVTIRVRVPETDVDKDEREYAQEVLASKATNSPPAPIVALAPVKRKT